MADYKKDIEDMENRLSLASPNVSANAKIVTPDTEGCEMMLHISTDTKIKKFIPLIGLRQAKTEDRTMPRICVSPNLLGCILGYASLIYDTEQVANPKKDDGYSGGWKIYGFKYGACLRPNNRLVYDASRSFEHWLVSYNEETTEFTPVEVGKFFWKEIRLIATTGKRPEIWIDYYVEVTDESGMRFSGNVFLEPGHYMISGPGAFQSKSEPNLVKTYKDDDDFRVMTISKSDYNAAKMQAAKFLSFDAVKPKFMGW